MGNKRERRMKCDITKCHRRGSFNLFDELGALLGRYCEAHYHEIHKHYWNCSCKMYLNKKQRLPFAKGMDDKFATPLDELLN